jgi:NitT/TauT family transport system permease protein/taurine transport system permease protein
MSRSEATTRTGSSLLELARATSRRELAALLRIGRVVGLFGAAKTVGPFLPLLILWIWVTRLEIWPRMFLPPPSSVLGSFGGLMRNGLYPLHVGDSLYRLLVGSLIAVALGVTAGLFIGVSRTAYRSLFPLITFFQSIAEIGWLPLAVIWFGFGLRTMLFVIGYTVFFPVALSTIVGVRSVPANLVNSIRTLGGRRYHVLFEVLLPGAFPGIISGIRVGIGYGWRALIAAEILVGDTGLGFMMFDARRFQMTERIILGMVTIGLLWLLTDRLVLKPIESETIQRWGLVLKAS